VVLPCPTSEIGLESFMGLNFMMSSLPFFSILLAPAACELGVTCGDVVTPVAPFNVTY
jgi:hypothetical protein